MRNESFEEMCERTLVSVMSMTLDNIAAARKDGNHNELYVAEKQYARMEKVFNRRFC